MDEADICKTQSVQFSHLVMSDSLWPHGQQHTRPPCSSQIPGVYSYSCPLSQWYHPTISFSVIPLSSHPQSPPTHKTASGSFQISQLFTSGGQSIGISASTSVLPMNIQDWFPLEWTGWISLQSKGLSRVFSSTTVQKHHSSALRFIQCSLMKMLWRASPDWGRWGADCASVACERKGPVFSTFISNGKIQDRLKKMNL